MTAQKIKKETKKLGRGFVFANARKGGMAEIKLS